MSAGTYEAKRKDGTIYYRASITHQGKHISLGSFPTQKAAQQAYQEAGRLLRSSRLGIDDYENRRRALSFLKWVILVNYRDKGIYIKTPIYMEKSFFLYFFSPADYLIFDIDDLFYYSSHTISRRGGHLFVADYGMQVNIMSRYGIKNHAVEGRDYRFVNGNPRDFRYGNIEVINRFSGVRRKEKNGSYYYETRIHVRSEYLVGVYQTEEEAAIAYNKAASILITKGYEKNYPVNYLEDLSSKEYQEIYKDLSISSHIRNLKDAPQN
ncbi:MAG: hypothetical protein K6G62_00015 [Eubacterium sp.]|nr:hypothetical protein [Eubacterium sp.]